jgi:hypothetical protein
MADRTKEDPIRASMALGMAALSVAMHTVRVLTNRGLISPNELQSIDSMFNETLESLGSESFQSSVVGHTSELMAEMHRLAKERWQGPDPEPLNG